MGGTWWSEWTFHCFPYEVNFGAAWCIYQSLQKLTLLYHCFNTQHLEDFIQIITDTNIRRGGAGVDSRGKNETCAATTHCSHEITDFSLNFLVMYSKCQTKTQEASSILIRPPGVWLTKWLFVGWNKKGCVELFSLSLWISVSSP